MLYSKNMSMKLCRFETPIECYLQGSRPGLSRLVDLASRVSFLSSTSSTAFYSGRVDLKSPILKQLETWKLTFIVISAF